MSRPIDAEDRQKPQKLIVRENRNNSDAYHLYCPICKWPVGEWYARSRWARMRTMENAVMLIIGLEVLAVGVYFLPKAWAYDHREEDYLDDSVWFLLPTSIVFIGFLWSVNFLYELVGWLASPTAKAVFEIVHLVK